MAQKIDFGNNVGYKINNFLIKKKIINYLVENIKVSQFIDNKIEDNNDLKNLKNNKYYICPLIRGDTYIFTSIKIKENYYSVLVNKKELKNFVDYNLNNLTMISLKIRLTKQTYDGTILDGRVVNLGGSFSFVINDCYYLYGKEMYELKVEERFNQINDFIDKSFIIDNNMSVIDFKLNRLYQYSEFKDLVKQKIPNSKYKFNAIQFIPKNENKKFIFYFDKKEQFVEEVILSAKKLSIDVIELFAKDKERVGIANIPNSKTSFLCNKYIGIKNFTPIKCKFNYNFKKWTPIEIYQDETNITSFSKIKDMVGIIS